MLGSTLDYLVLRSLAHTRNRATEEELDSGPVSALHDDQEHTKLPKVLRRFEGRFPVDPSLSYLDMGCGSGEITLGLAKLGLTDITGVDFLPRFIAAARQNAREAGLEGTVRFECADLRAWQPPKRYDVLISFDALEHIDQPRAFLARMAQFLAPGGVAALEFGPLFHSPFGDHMYGFYKVQLPWRGVLFREEAMLRVRRECYRPTDPATRYQDIAGGLNLMRYSDFLRDARETGWRFRFLRGNAMLRNAALRRISDAVLSVPRVRDYFVHNVYAILERADGGSRRQ